LPAWLPEYGGLYAPDYSTSTALKAPPHRRGRPPLPAYLRALGILRTFATTSVAEVLGFHAAILLTGHYGPNWEDLKTLVSHIQPYVGTRRYALPDFEANQPGFDNDGQSSGMTTPGRWKRRYSGGLPGMRG
jgi:hypothetical protein